MFTILIRAAPLKPDFGVEEMKNHSRPRRHENGRESEAPAEKQFFVVGIGASAGGLEAVSRLVGSLPADFGMALVLVTHMSRTQESSLPEILSKVSKIPVMALTENILVKPNHLYVMSPDSEIVLPDGNLKIVPCESDTKIPLPIDRFFLSLASTKAEHAIGIILSGEGSDGSLGIRAIKEEGGITFAQDPNTTAHPSMPLRAMASGAVDCVLSPEDIASELQKLSTHPKHRPSGGEIAPEEEDEDIAKVLAAIHRIAGIDFSPYKQATIRRRIERRMLLHKAKTVASYLKHLEDDSTEVGKLFDDLLIKVTGFFRDPDLFEVLRRKVLPRLKTKDAKAPIRIWVPGCSTGEEVYSMAIAVVEFLEHRGPLPEIQIFGTDLSEKAIRIARDGTYAENVTAGLTKERLRRFFKAGDQGYQISKSIRDICVFANHDITRDPPFSHVDLVSCRNLLIYFNLGLQKKVISIFHYALNPDGFLVLGTSETISRFSDAFRLADKKNKIYSKKISTRSLHLEFSKGQDTKKANQIAQSQIKGNNYSHEDGLVQAVDRIILSQMTPPGFLVNTEFEILQFRGNTAPYVRHPHGTPNLNLLKIIHRDLTMEVRKLTSASQKKKVS